MGQKRANPHLISFVYTFKASKLDNTDALIKQIINVSEGLIKKHRIIFSEAKIQISFVGDNIVNEKLILRISF